MISQSDMARSNRRLRGELATAQREINGAIKSRNDAISKLAAHTEATIAAESRVTELEGVLTLGPDAIERLITNYRKAVRGESVRDMAETIAEGEAFASKAKQATPDAQAYTDKIRGEGRAQGLEEALTACEKVRAYGAVKTIARAMEAITALKTQSHNRAE